MCHKDKARIDNNLMEPCLDPYRHAFCFFICWLQPCLTMLQQKKNTIQYKFFVSPFCMFACCLNASCLIYFAFPFFHLVDCSNWHLSQIYTHTVTLTWYYYVSIKWIDIDIVLCWGLLWRSFNLSPKGQIPLENMSICWWRGCATCFHFARLALNLIFTHMLCVRSQSRITGIAILNTFMFPLWSIFSK